MHTLLQKGGVAGPYVMVGHSLGGMYARMFQDKYRSEVVGMVLVDASHPDQDERFPPEAKKLAARGRYVIRAMQIALPFGLPRIIASHTIPVEVRALGTLGDLPLIVLSHDPENVRFPGNLTEPVNQAWGKMQEELAHLS